MLVQYQEEIKMTLFHLVRESEVAKIVANVTEHGTSVAGKLTQLRAY